MLKSHPTNERIATTKLSCIVLGGGGFIGTNLCRRLVASGHRVRAFGRRSLFPADLDGVEWYQGDFGDVSSLAAAMESFDTVFHLVHATMPQTANLDIPNDVRRNVIPSIALLDLCQRLGVRRVVFASSGGTIYGCAPQIPTPETAPTDPITAYAISKLAIEKYLGLYEHLYGLSYRALRITNPFGPFQIALKNQGFIAAVVSRAVSEQVMEIWGDGSAVRDFVFIDDVVDALELAATSDDAERVYNIGSGEGRSLREVIAVAEELFGAKLRIEWKPGRAVDVPKSVVAIDRARRGLDWEPRTPFETGLAKTIEWGRSRRADIERFFR
jgi:UDP-glucose 4-epimerase